MTSALQVKPQPEQTNSAWFLREVLSIHPQSRHRTDVWLVLGEPAELRVRQAGEADRSVELENLGEQTGIGPVRGDG
ncbi:hypothetical protein ACWDKQ_25385 [Saccharopolyspora sp. NPDC000995]